jgi:hypothetical protein
VLQKQSSDESYSSTTSSSRTHRRTTSPNGRSSIGSEGSSSDDGVKSPTSKATDPLRVSWSASVSGAHSQEVDVMDRSREGKIGRKILGSGGEEDESLRALELIRQLSFSPPRMTKKRTDTADMDVSSSSSSETSDTDHNHNTSPIGLDLKHLQELRMGSPSPLVGLQYLPDGNMYI